MIRATIVGAAGRMGRRLIANVMENDSFTLAGAVEYPGSPLLGADAGEVAGCGKAGVAISADLATALKGADVAICFSNAGAYECAELAVNSGVSVVIGTTTLTPDERKKLRTLAAKGGKLVVAGNMSVGVNLLYKLVGEAARTLGTDYNVEIVEMHHNQKKDAPSGTAARLAEVVCEARDWDPAEVLKYGRCGVIGERPAREIGMHSLRGGDVVGDHTVIFSVNGERVELTHKASSRDTFARGALRAAEFLAAAAPGLYDMQDVLGLK